jgi:hypothetical protein
MNLEQCFLVCYRTYNSCSSSAPAGHQDQRSLEAAGAQGRGDHVQDLLIPEEMDEAVDAVGKVMMGKVGSERYGVYPDGFITCVISYNDPEPCRSPCGIDG